MSEGQDDGFTTDELRKLFEAMQAAVGDGATEEEEEDTPSVTMPVEDLAGITIALCDPSPMNRASLAIEITQYIVEQMDNLPEEEAKSHAIDIVFRHLEGFLSKAICEENPEDGDCQ